MGQNLHQNEFFKLSRGCNNSYIPVSKETGSQKHISKT